MYTNLRPAIRGLRRAKGWTQAVLGGRCGASRELISRLERGELGGMTMGAVDRVAQALGATLHVSVRWQGERLDRLLDAAHASIQQRVAALLTSLGWEVHVEVSFSHYGDRGRVDIVAFHPRVRVVLIVEIKSGLGDLQDTLGRLDVKARLGPRIARQLGWESIAGVIPVLVIGDSRAARRTIRGHDALFHRYSLRGRAAVAWCRQPRGALPTGMLWFVPQQDVRHR